MFYKLWEKVFSSFKMKPYSIEKKIIISALGRKNSDLKLIRWLYGLSAMFQNLENKFSFTCLNLLWCSVRIPQTILIVQVQWSPKNFIQPSVFTASLIHNYTDWTSLQGLKKCFHWYKKCFNTTEITYISHKWSCTQIIASMIW